MDTSLPNHKTKIVCTIGPASRSRDVLKGLIMSGMDVARLNFSHSDPAGHEKDIRAVKELSESLGKRIAVLADLPGPKVRIGDLKGGSCTLQQGDRVVLTTADLEGTSSLIPVQFPEFPDSVEVGQRIFLNDGFIELKIVRKNGRDIGCEVVIGGVLLSKKGMNLPDSHIRADAVTQHDLDLLAYGIEMGVDMFGLSFVSGPDDIAKARDFAKGKGREIFVVAKIERNEALSRIDGIIQASDAIMVARGDLGVEIPIDEVPIVQKQIILQANIASKPVITATQMLESMVGNTRPTRAEVTDAANAIFDGTDAVMLSEETAIGRYPVDACRMLARIAATAESRRASVVSGMIVPETVKHSIGLSGVSIEDTLSLDVVRSAGTLGVSTIIVPTMSGLTARRISRFKGDAWIIALSASEAVLRALCLSYGVHPVSAGTLSSDADGEIVERLRSQGLIQGRKPVILVMRETLEGQGTANSMKIITPGS